MNLDKWLLRQYLNKYGAFISSCKSVELRATLKERLDSLSIHGKNTDGAYCKKIKGSDGIYEIKAKDGEKQARIFFCFLSEESKQICILYCFYKKKDDYKREIKLAEKNKKLVMKNKGLLYDVFN